MNDADKRWYETWDPEYIVAQPREWCGFEPYIPPYDGGLFVPTKWLRKIPLYDNLGIHGSIVRDGNHFLCYDKKWFLVDGPWYERLSLNTHHPVRYARIQLPNFGTYHRNDIPEYVEEKYIIWDKVQLHPGYFIGKPDYDSPFYGKWSEWNWKRMFYGWICNDGVLPCCLNSVDYVEDYWRI